MVSGECLKGFWIIMQWGLTNNNNRDIYGYIHIGVILYLENPGSGKLLNCTQDVVETLGVCLVTAHPKKRCRIVWDEQFPNGELNMEKSTSMWVCLKMRSTSKWPFLMENTI